MRISIFSTALFLLLGSWQPAFSQSYRFQHETLPCVKKKFSIVSHIFADSLGNYGVTEQEIKDAVDGMNNFFSPIMVSFEVCEFRYYNNFEHDTLSEATESAAIMTKYHAHQRTNFYFLSRLQRNCVCKIKFVCIANVKKGFFYI